jgi:hypothetical protein
MIKRSLLCRITNEEDDRAGFWNRFNRRASEFHKEFL